MCKFLKTTKITRENLVSKVSQNLSLKRISDYEHYHKLLTIITSSSTKSEGLNLDKRCYKEYITGEYQRKKRIQENAKSDIL